MKELSYKGWSRAYVQTAEDAEKAKQILLKLDDFEYGYMPDDFFCVHGSPVGLVWNGKFDPDIDEWTKACDAAGIDISFRSETDAQYNGEEDFSDRDDYGYGNDFYN